MERQKKPWSELTEEERQEIRDSWKHTLPEEYDVFCIGDFTVSEDLTIPGNLYVGGNLDSHGHNINVAKSLTVKLEVYTHNVTVGNNLIVYGDVECFNVRVGGNFIVYADNIETLNIIVNGDVIVYGEINSTAIRIDNLLYCYDVYSNSCGISASDFACRCYEEENL